jgi:hypothetical protein
VAAPASPVSSEGKSKRGGWDKLTPEQKAERAAKMQAGRKANAAAKAAAKAAEAVTPAPVAAPAPAPAPAPVAVAAPAPAPVAEETATEVEEVVIKGVTYLRSPEGFLFDLDEEPVGYFNAETGEIEEVETD